MSLAAKILAIADHPKPGVIFRDITTLLADADAFADTVNGLAEPFKSAEIAKVVGIEARGFILGGAVALRLGAGFAPMRKAGKLPRETLAETYELEYGTDTVELHLDAVAPGERVLIVDDLVATGGTAEAAVNLLRRLGADIVACAFVIDLTALGGADRLRRLGVSTMALVNFG